MATQQVAEEIVVDLLRSVWVVEQARASVYESWAETDARWGDSAARTLKRAGLVEQALQGAGRRTDEKLVEPHTDWMRGLVGDDPDEVPLSTLFLGRLGDWIDGHAAGALGASADQFTAINQEERGLLEFPTQLPPPPPFEPFQVPEVAAPGEVKVRVAILGDLHIGSKGGDALAAAAVADVDALQPDLVVQLGDITDHGEADEFRAAAELMGKLDVPVLTVMGNHDVAALSESRLSGSEYYRAHFGRDPDGAMLELNGFRFAALDSVDHSLSPYPAFDLVSGGFIDGPGGAIVRGALSVPQHEILADIAAPGTSPAFVFLHHPPQPFTGFPPILFGLRDADSGRLHATADSGNVWGIFAGHTHRNAVTTTYGPVPAHEVAIARDYPHGFGMLEIAREGYAYRFIQVSDDEALREAAPKASAILRRYAGGPPEARAFVWERPG